ncbi:MAG: type II CAAX endopeptidase family protein [Eubacteriales bacterium]|nr:type II CAAX endopeptidase family protein [Eubacteriales bacterium]
MTSGKAGGLFLSIILFHIAAVLAISAVGMFFPAVYGMWPGTLLSEGIVVIPTLIFALCTPASFSEMFPFRRIRISTAALSVLVTALVFPLITLVNSLSMLAVDNTVSSMSSDILSYPFWQMALLIGVIGPFLEEFVFRGYVFRSLRSSGRVIGSVLVSALLFGLMHLNFNQASYAAVLGIFLALLAEASGSIWPSFLVHCCFNTFEIAMLYLQNAMAESGAGQWAEEAAQTQSAVGGNSFLALGAEIFMAAAGAALALLAIRLIAALERGKTPEREQSGLGTQRPLLSFALVLGVLLSVAYMVFSELFLL